MISHAVVPIRSAAILTTSYVTGSVPGVDVTEKSILQTSNQVVLLIDFTIGSLTSAEMKIEFSADGSNWYQETFGALTGAGTSLETLGIHQFTASGAYRVAFQLKDRFFRVSVKGTGTTTSSSMTVKAVIGNV